MGESNYAETSLSRVRYSVDVKAFNLELFSALSGAEFVKHIEIETEAIVVKEGPLLKRDDLKVKS